MKIPKNIIFGELAAKKKNKILKAIKNKKYVFDVYIITLPTASGILEIYPSYILTKQDNIDNDITIVGIARGKDEAMEIVSDVLLDCYKKLNSFDTKKYFAER